MVIFVVLSLVRISMGVQQRLDNRINIQQNSYSSRTDPSIYHLQLFSTDLVDMHKHSGEQHKTVTMWGTQPHLSTDRL